MPGIGRSVEVTGAPGTAVHALDDAATRGGTNPSRVHAAARRALSATAEIAGAWCPDTETTLLTLFGGASYPLLAAAYEAGAGPIRSVPRWSDAILAEPDPRHAARLAFGQKATRPVVAAFARSLVRVEPAPVDLSRLALALIGGDVLEPDQLATVLPAAGPSWPDRSLPAPRQLERARAVTKRWGPERTLGYLLQAAADDAARRLLIECVDHAIDLQFHAPIHLPAGLEDLRAVYLLQIRSTAETSRAAPRRRRAPRHATRPARTEQRDRVDYGQLLAPRVRSLTPITASTPIRHPGWLRNVDGSSVGGFTFVLPGTCGDLERWSQAMANCLDTFKSAAVEGASHLVGILADGRHRYVLEVGPDRAIRQFSGRANRPVVRSDHDEIIAHLRSRSVLQRPIA
ncbi:MAG TPA: hypothetical protein VFN21_00725 [Acidimicrobiales bacterium]|nr:hypothetical protein [Acidimicrobiales bacterium]